MPSTIAVRSYSTGHASIETKSLPQPSLAMSCTVPAVHGYWSHRCFRKSTPAAVGVTSLWVKLKRLLRAGYCARVSAQFVVATEINSEQ